MAIQPAHVNKGLMSCGHAKLTCLQAQTEMRLCPVSLDWNDSQVQGVYTHAACVVLTRLAAKETACN